MHPLELNHAAKSVHRKGGRVCSHPRTTGRSPTMDHTRDLVRIANHPPPHGPLALGDILLTV